MLLLTVVSLVIASVPSSVFASCAPQSLTTQTTNADAIVLGSVTEAVGSYWSVTVHDVFKGTVVSPIFVTGTSDTPTSIDVNLEPQMSYLLFLEEQTNGVYKTNACMGSRVLTSDGLTTDEQQTLVALPHSPAATPVPTPPPTPRTKDTTLSFFPVVSKPIWSLVFFLFIWEMIWKGMALWKAGQHRQLIWFIVLFIFNTGGILPIIYLVFLQPTQKRRGRSKK